MAFETPLDFMRFVNVHTIKEHIQFRSGWAKNLNLAGSPKNTFTDILSDTEAIKCKKIDFF